MWSFFALSLLTAFGDVRSYSATRVTGGPTIDGLLNDDAWAGAQEQGKEYELDRRKS